MENFADYYSMPVASRDIGTGFMLQQMPMTMCGYMPMGTYGVSPLKPTLTSDKFEYVQKQKNKDKAQRNKVLKIVGGTLAAVVGLLVLKRNMPAVKTAFQKATTWVTNLFKKAPTGTP